MSERRVGRPPGRDPERAATILAAAARAFAAGGYRATSMADVAAAAGVSKLVVYRHYGSKRDLYRAVLDDVKARLEAVGQRQAPGTITDPYGATTASVRAMIAVARERPDAFRLLHVNAPREPEFAPVVEAMRRPGIANAERLLAGLMPDPMLRAWLAAVVERTVDEAVLGWLETGDPGRDGEAAAHVAAMLGGMVGAVAFPGGARP